MSNLFEDNGAAFSECRKYRYALWRIWEKDKPFIMFIGLNPSTANETKTDPTITRVRSFATDWGYGGFYMMNLFSFVTAYPEELVKPESNDVLNDQWLRDVGEKCNMVIFAWGNFKQAVDRSKEVMAMFPEAYALVVNQNGSPRHPLYVKGDVIPVKFESWIKNKPIAKLS